MCLIFSFSKSSYNLCFSEEKLIPAEKKALEEEGGVFDGGVFFLYLVQFSLIEKAEKF